MMLYRLLKKNYSQVQLRILTWRLQQKHFWSQRVSTVGNKKIFFAREPIRRLAICLNTNEAFLGNNRQNPFNFRKFDLEQIYSYRNGLPVQTIRYQQVMTNVFTLIQYWI